MTPTIVAVAVLVAFVSCIMYYAGYLAGVSDERKRK